MSTEKFSATVMNPVAKVETEAAITPAARLACLESKKIALWWNGKSKGNVALNTIAERLKKDYNAETVFLNRICSTAKRLSLPWQTLAVQR